MNEDGTNIRQITYDSSFPVVDGVWSPDGDVIAITSPVGGIDYYGSAIYLINPDGTQRHRLVESTGDQPVWSPDGKTIAFYRYIGPDGAGQTDIFLIDVDGTHERRLTETPTKSEQVDSWSSDGRYLYFSFFDFALRDSAGQYTNKNDQVGRMMVNGDSVRVLLLAEGGARGALVSPDDSLLVFDTFVPFISRGGLADQMQLLRLSGSGYHPLRQNDYRWEWAVGWSPDGKKILFNYRDDQRIPHQNAPQAISITNIDGNNVKRITPFDYAQANFFATSWRRR